MKKRNKIILLLAGGVVVLVILIFLFIKYAPWHKLMKIPMYDKTAFVPEDKQKITAPNVISLNFEVDSTHEVPNGIYRGIAHSGNYSARVFGKNSFSISVVRSAEEIGLKNLNGIALSAWVYVLPSDHEVNASLVFAATNSVGVTICWRGVNFSGPLIPREKWTKVSGYFDLSDIQLRKDDKIQLYFWNNSETELLVDDFYFVFGAPRDRKGDSILVDKTRQVDFIPRFNYPPFRLLYMHPAQLKRLPGVWLISENDRKQGEITPSDKVITGHFIQPYGDAQSILVIKPSSAPELYHYCSHQQSFIQIPLGFPPDMLPVTDGLAWMTGRFTATNYDQILMAGPHNLALYTIEKKAEPCSNPSAAAILKTIWQSDQPVLEGVTIGAADKWVCGDFTGDQRDEVLIFGPDGSWKLLQFSPEGISGGKWTPLATGEEYKVREWNAHINQFRVTAAPFLSGTGRDLLLTTFRNIKTGKCNYSLLKYVPADQKFIPIFPDRQGSNGCTIGWDTLKPSDQFHLLYPLSGKPPSFLRYNRDWRFDLKEIAFNDTTFQILSTVDFSGFPGDQNPKYYEVLAIHTGCWIDPNLTSVMVIGRNCKDSRYAGVTCPEYEEYPGLPSTLEIYEPDVKK